jgi:hypothetical protein
MSRSIEFSYAVGSHRPGDYEIPSIAVTVDGERLRTLPLKLTVRPSASGAPQGMEGEGDGPAASDEYGYLTFQMVDKDRRHVYPGEIAPVRIRAYFPIDSRVSLSGPPRPDGSAFTLHNLTKEPDQDQAVVNGRRYLVVTWYGGLSATKAGTYPASFTLEGTVAVRDRSAKRRPSPFDDPFFGRSLLDDFLAPMIQKEVSLKTEDPPELEVRELPAEGRPEDFTGAIGKFEFGPVEVATSMRTGEPARMRAQIQGEGNFALLQQPRPLPADEWKTYEGKDDFQPGDAASFGGAKRFEFSAVPRQPGKKRVSLGFSYFDPDEGEYRRVESVPREVEITGQPLAERERAGEAVEPSAPAEPKLAPIRRELGAVSLYSPLTTASWFVPAMAGCGGLAIALVGWGVWKERRKDPAKLARREARLAEARALLEAGEAVRKGDSPAFFAAARAALRVRFAGVAGIRPEAVTLADLTGRVDEGVLELWRVADRLDYSGEAEGAGDLENWRLVLERGMQALESPSA